MDNDTKEKPAPRTTGNLRAAQPAERAKRIIVDEDKPVSILYGNAFVTFTPGERLMDEHKIRVARENNIALVEK